ncbi:MAG: DUF1801 domain-containing protein [Acidimicrobiia bacterium]
MDQEARDYIDAIAPERRPLFDRLDGLIRETYPDADLTWSYKMPTYVVGARRIHLAAWKHGISIYGWQADRDAGFTQRHPELVTGKGTLQLRVDAADAIPDAELLAFFGAALGD